MITEEIPIKRLLPIELGLLSEVAYSLHHNFDEKLFEPIVAVRFHDSFVLGDGHHRSALMEFRGQRNILTNILENDEDLWLCEKGIFYDKRYTNLNQFINQYRFFWKKELEDLGIRSVSDYNVKRLIREYDKFLNF
jgi:hypothetical protein